MPESNNYLQRSIPTLCLIFCFISLSIHAQELSLIGVVKNDSGIELPNANILAYPISENENTRFAIANENGEFNLKLKKNISYNISISYLGYQRLSFELTLNETINKSFTLEPSLNQLDEVILNFKIPVSVKKDTITYDADSFKTGKERKVRELLKKLPGLEIDREGKVTAQGKTITKVLVDNKIFFTGNSKLAINNIPANVVDQIEILDNYNSVGFLKGLQETEEVALNIKLKKEKNKFAFGELELGGGIENRFIGHPTLFYYSPKTKINFIGDLNNVGSKTFSLNDYIEFEGGFGKLTSNTRSYSSLLDSDLAKYLYTDDYKALTSRFGAFNLRYSATPKTDINTYVIANKSNSDTEIQNINEYSNDNDPFIETRKSSNNLENISVIGKLTVDYKPDSNEVLSINSFLKLNNSAANGNISTNSFQRTTEFKTLNTFDNINLKQNLNYNKKISKNQTISAEAILSYKKDNPTNNWLSTEAFLQDLIPLQEDSNYSIFQEKENEDISFDLILKDYWVLNNFNHLYTAVGSNLFFQEYITNDEQRLSDGSTNNFANSGFGNDINYHFNDLYAGIEYKFMTGIFTVKPSLYYHNYFIKEQQFSRITKNSTNVLVPEVNIETKLNDSEKLKFQYALNLRFPNSIKRAGNFLLSNFNSVFKGSEELSYERYHSYTINYNKFSLFRGLNLNASLFYTKKTQSIKNTTILDGIEHFTTLTMFRTPENSLNAKLNYSKKIGVFKLGLENTGTYNEFFQLINSTSNKNISKTLNTTSKIETYFNRLPNLEIGYTYSPSLYKANNFTSKFTNNEYFINLDFNFFEDFQFKANYSRINFQNNERISNYFDNSNITLFYKKEDSPWGFEIEANNLFNTEIKQENSFNDFVISNQQTFILPRILLFKVSYKL